MSLATRIARIAAARQARFMVDGRPIHLLSDAELDDIAARLEAADRARHDWQPLPEPNLDPDAPLNSDIKPLRLLTDAELDQDISTLTHRIQSATT